MSEVNTTHALSCLQRVGETCDCWVKDADMIAEEILGPEEAPAEELHGADCDCVISLSRACDCDELDRLSGRYERHSERAKPFVQKEAPVDAMAAVHAYVVQPLIYLWRNWSSTFRRTGP